MLVAEVTVVGGVAGASNVETVAEGIGEGLAMSIIHVKMSGGGSCLGGKEILSGRM